MRPMRVFSRRGTVGALALLVDMLAQRWPDRWSDVSTAVAGMLLGQMARALPGSLGLWAEAAILSSALGMNRARVDATDLAQRLAVDDVAGARRAGARLLGCDTQSMDGAALAARAIEAVARDGADEVIAPLFYYLVAGLPGAMVYQLLVAGGDTLGSCSGDLISRARLLPRRLTGLLYVAVRHLKSGEGAAAWRVWHAPSKPSSGRDADGTSLMLAQMLSAGREPAPTTSTGAAVQQALDTARGAVALAEGALLVLGLVSRTLLRTRRHSDVKG